MANKTLIEWTDRTSNPLLARPIGDDSVKIGWFCDKPDKNGGCLHCYAETINRRFGNKRFFSNSGRDKIEFLIRSNEIDSLLKLNAKHPHEKVFVADMFDLFQPSIPLETLHKLFETFDACDKLQLQFLTKYPARMNHFLGERYKFDIPKHFWIGMSAANQEWFNRNFMQLAHINALRFLSLEPLLGPIDISNYLHVIDWVIVGGESGTGARLCDVIWIRSIVEQCKASGTPVFVKQLGSKPYVEGFNASISNRTIYDGNQDQTYLMLISSKGGEMSEWPNDLRIREFPR